MLQLTREQQFFIDTLKNYILENESAACEALDWNAIKKYADHHQVTAIFYKQTKQPIFQSAYASQLYRYVNFEKVIQSLKEALKDYSYAMVKGVTVSGLYPVPALRSMGDVDVLIHEEDGERICSALTDLGFELQMRWELGDWIYTKNGYIFELHDSLVHRYEGKEKLVEYFSHAWEYVKDGELTWSFHLIYLLEHLRQHFVGHGVGFRQFMDVAIVCKKCNIDWEFVSDELKKINLYDFASTVFAFINHWFELSVPFEKSEISEEFFIRASSKIFEDGVFGFDNEENQNTDLTFQMYYKGLEYKKAKKDYVIRTAFPEYEAMCKLPYCAYVKRGKVLLPWAWIHRIIYRAFNKKSRRSVKARLSKDRIEARMNMLKEWGL